MDFLDQLKSGERIEQPVALVLAHPDDETASAAGLLQRLVDPRLIYVTDGAPRDLVDARREGFKNWRDYADLRKCELRKALQSLGVSAAPVFCDYPDKEALDQLPELVERLSADLAGAKVVLTHPYEHGHPDHDTSAVAVTLACARLGQTAPKRMEFAGYHLRQDGPVFGAFWPGSEEVVVEPTAEEMERKRAALASYASQCETLAQFPVRPERYRRAPDYRFTDPAPPRRALYDLYGWKISSDRWRARVTELLE